MKILLFIIFINLPFLASPIERSTFTQEYPLSQLEHNSSKWSRSNLNEFIKLIKNPTLNYLHRDYNQQKLQKLLDSYDSGSDEDKVILSQTIDRQATDSFLAYAKDLSVGLIDWDKFQNKLSSSDVDLIWEKRKKEYKYESDLSLALKTNMLAVLMHKYIPIDKAYRDLIKAYHRYSSLEFPSIDYGPLMKVGDYGYRATQLKKFLKATSDLSDIDDIYLDFPTYDEKLKKALKRFQKRHYLNVTGELDRVTVMYTKKSAKEKLDLIKLNIERYKLYPRIYEGEYIVINIPEFSLKYFQYAEKISDIFVVIGREDRPTPIFSDELEYIVLNPSWIVPQGLIHKDYIPKLVVDPHSLDDHEIYIHTRPSRLSKKVDTTKINWEKYLDNNKTVPYFFMQYPGDNNVLGRMKFIFPNKYKVYLHDTNSKLLTSLKYRLYSSGCIRLQKPYELLAILSEKTKMDIDTMISKLESKKTVNVPLNKKIPIHIRYNTVFIEADNSVTFRRDFYGYDKIQLKTLR